MARLSSVAVTHDEMRIHRKLILPSGSTRHSIVKRDKRSRDEEAARTKPRSRTTSNGGGKAAGRERSVRVAKEDQTESESVPLATVGYCSRTYCAAGISWKLFEAIDVTR
jgi:hypothetical protein